MAPHQKILQQVIESYEDLSELYKSKAAMLRLELQAGGRSATPRKGKSARNTEAGQAAIVRLQRKFKTIDNHEKNNGSANHR